MKKMFASLAFVLVLAAGAGVVRAQTLPAPVESPTPDASVARAPTPAPSASPLKLLSVSGYADAAYVSRIGPATTRFATLDPLTGELGQPFPSRVFDYVDRTPNVQNLNLQLALAAGNLAGKLELSAGSDADIMASYPAAFNGFDVTQAYLAYTAGKFTLQAGKFESLAGAEGIESPSDLNFSRSILFGFAVPFTHTGARLTYVAAPHFNLIGGVNAGWDEIRSANGRLTAEYGASYFPSPAVALTAQGYTGIEQLANYANPYDPYGGNGLGLPGIVTLPTGNEGNDPGGAPPGAQGQRTLLDAVATVHPTSSSTVTLNYDHGRQSGFIAPNGTILAAGWSGLAGYAAQTFGPRLTGALRYEGFHDPQGYRTGIPGGQFWREGTATLGYALSGAVTVRGEYRYDVSDRAVFLRAGNSGLTDADSTLALDTLVKF